MTSGDLHLRKPCCPLSNGECWRTCAWHEDMTKTCESLVRFRHGDATLPYNLSARQRKSTAPTSLLAEKVHASPMRV